MGQPNIEISPNIDAGLDNSTTEEFLILKFLRHPWYEDLTLIPDDLTFAKTIRKNYFLATEWSDSLFLCKIASSIFVLDKHTKVKSVSQHSKSGMISMYYFNSQGARLKKLLSFSCDRLSYNCERKVVQAAILRFSSSDACEQADDWVWMFWVYVPSSKHS